MIRNRLSTIPREKIAPFLATTSIVAMCLLGFFFRIYFYGVNRSLWLDEAMLALNLVNRSFLELMNPLDFSQGAPVGFLFLQKAVISILGNSDYILRLFPLLSGLASIPLMYSISKQYGRGLAPYISLGLFAFSASLIYYSSELKQYSSDVLVTLLLLFIVPKSLQEKVSSNVFIALGFTGVLAIWFSHPALFILTGIILTLGLAFTKQRNSYKLWWLVGIIGVWGINLILLYFISLQHLVANNVLLNYWSSGFAPLPPWSHLNWYYNSLGGMLNNPARLPFNVIIVGLLILGIFSYCRPKGRAPFAAQWYKKGGPCASPKLGPGY